MSHVFGKLQFKDQARIHVLGAPAEFKAELDEIRDKTEVATRSDSRQRYGFVMVFVKKCADIGKQASKAVARLDDDGLLWFAYPKKSSKRYDSDIGRDDSWQPLGDLGFEGVRQVAIDADWSALRFRHVDFIKALKRDPEHAMSAKGKRRARRKA